MLATQPSSEENLLEITTLQYSYDQMAHVFLDRIQTYECSSCLEDFSFEKQSE